MLKMGVEESIQEAIEEARKRVQKIDIGYETFLQKARRYAQEGNIDIVEQIEEIKRARYKSLLPLAIGEANERAQNGKKGFQIFLAIAQSYASRLGEDIAEHIGIIERRGYERATELELDNAKNMAKVGDIGFQSALEKAELYHNIVKLHIDNEIIAIKKTGYSSIIPGILEKAEERATNGDSKYMPLLKTAEGYAAKINMDISTKVNEIKKIYNG